MRLWVIARAEVWPALQEQKSLRNDRGRRPEYAWLCEEMRLRVPGYAGPSVWWAWYLVDGRSGVAATPCTTATPGRRWSAWPPRYPSRRCC